MLKLVLFSALFYLALAHRGPGRPPKPYSSEESDESQEVGILNASSLSNNSTLLPCPTPCPDGANCTSNDCINTGNCTGTARCLNTTCGMKCVAPMPGMPCSAHPDCSPYICCRERCDNTCVFSLDPPSRPLRPKKKYYRWF
ncbi:multiple epidermal growth factor-like domains protein 11 isoform X2 [Microcaecilia unicolor]|nr:multiple epidermal growth factor-like domains protein 11 isoform X2 [Microcaecilia unicolor]XP_030043690.1 multiple epidermal growth factor-like domains protein 11 isoform X2 [Microcaecilia unicolor]XP_030043691.1 multiple epidermal growth factor-like domains protein 11 isoform X2 [Microcaecilia unicolor]